MNRWNVVAAGAAVLLLGVDPALARHRHHHQHSTRHHTFDRQPPSFPAAGLDGCIYDNNGRQLCVQPQQQSRVTRHQRVQRQRKRVTAGRHHQIQTAARVGGCTYDNNGRQICLQPAQAAYGYADAADTARRREVSTNNGTIIGGRPAGCPRAYCGCGLRKYLGLADKRLNLAWNWARLFPRAVGPAPGVAAVRGHHVMYIEGAAGNGLWTVRDYNSGRGLSRIHVRDVRGYVFVNPRA